MKLSHTEIKAHVHILEPELHPEFFRDNCKIRTNPNQIDQKELRFTFGQTRATNITRSARLVKQASRIKL